MKLRRNYAQSQKAHRLLPAAVYLYCTLAWESAVLVASAANLLVNADFQSGTPGKNDFAWTLELAPGPNNQCSVIAVEQPVNVVPSCYEPLPPGTHPGKTAVRLYQDELGSSTIKQEIQAQPWRWYLAEVCPANSPLGSLQ